MFTKKKARGSGYAEILIETTLLITETLVIVISGKAYSKALFNLKAVESHERLLFKVFGDEVLSVCSRRKKQEDLAMMRF